MCTLVACRLKRLVACDLFWSLVMLFLMVACRATGSSPCTFWEAGNFIRASMEPEYDEKLVWVEPAPANPDDAARPQDQAADESPWGEGI